LSAGAKDFITKPFDTTEVVLRVANLLQSRALHTGLRQHNASLAAELRSLGHEIAVVGATPTAAAPWGPVAIEVARRVAQGAADQGIGRHDFFHAI